MRYHFGEMSGNAKVNMARWNVNVLAKLSDWKFLKLETFDIKIVLCNCALLPEVSLEFKNGAKNLIVSIPLLFHLFPFRGNDREANENILNPLRDMELTDPCDVTLKKASFPFAHVTCFPTCSSFHLGRAGCFPRCLFFSFSLYFCGLFC